MRTLLEVVRLSTEFLQRSGSSSPRLDAELLTAQALGLRRLDLYLQHDRPLGPGELSSIRELIRRRGAGEPVAYILQRREFYGRPFLVTPAVLIPRPETETVVEVVLEWARSVGAPGGEGLHLADLGTGSGALACTVAAELPGAEVVATDTSPAALAVAGENTRELGLESRVSLRQGSWGEALAPESPLDAVLSNPPYVTTAELADLDRDVRDFEPRAALEGGADGLGAYPPVIAAAVDHLRSGGLLTVEVDPRRASAVAQLIRSRPGFDEPRTTADLAGRPRVVSAVWVGPGEALRPADGGTGDTRGESPS